MSKKHREVYEEEKNRMHSEGAVEHPEEVSKEESEADAAGETQETIDSEASSMRLRKTMERVRNSPL